jgi:hypothetical protein
VQQLLDVAKTIEGEIMTPEMVTVCMKVLKFELILKPGENYLALFGLDKREFKFS